MHSLSYSSSVHAMSHLHPAQQDSGCNDVTATPMRASLRTLAAGHVIQASKSCMPVVERLLTSLEGHA